MSAAERLLRERVVRAAMRMVAPKGFGYFGTHNGYGLCSVRKMRAQESACAALAALRKGKRT